MFDGNKIEIYSEYATMIDKLYYTKDNTEGIFTRIFDIFMVGAVIGAINGVSEMPKTKDYKKTIFEGVLSKNDRTIDFLVRTIILHDNKISEDDKIVRAFREYRTNDDIKRVNENMIKGYSNAGIRMLYDKHMENLEKNVSKEESINNFLELYEVESDYVDLKEKILKLARK